MNANVSISNKIPFSNCFPEGLIHEKSASFQTHAWCAESEKVFILCLRLLARRHYVFGLSVRPSEARITLFPPVHGSVGLFDQP